MTTGIDYAFSPHPSVAQLRSHGACFVGRYLAAEAPLGGAKGKIISVTEKDEILAAGLSLVLFHEWGATAMLGGHPAGAAAAHSDNQQLAQLGMTGCPVYNVADFDAYPSQQAAIHAYQDGYASVRGWAMTGLYGGYWVVSRARAAGKATYTCGTTAWSGSNWSGGGWKPTIMQGDSFMIGSASCDWDTAYAADYGQWPRPGSKQTASPAPAWQEAMMNVLPVISTTRNSNDADLPHWFIRRIQLVANGVFHASPPLAVDGAYGSSTAAAVTAIQQQHGLAADGIVGPATWALLVGTA